MQSITSTCTRCKTKYRVSVLQLRIAQGKVCCFKCSHTFNAYRCMSDQYKLQQIQTIAEQNQDKIEKSKTHHHPMLDIFESKSNSSNIDLQTYLNNTHYLYPQHITPNSQHTLKLHPLKGHYRPKKSSFPLLIVALFWITLFGLFILVGLTYLLIGIG